jgi:type II secretory pathway component PulF
MLKFKYIARDQATGQKIKSEVQADSESSAIALIRKENLVPIDIRQAGDGGGKGGSTGKKVPAKERILFSRQMATLINAGLPLMQSLRSVVDQMVNKNLKAIGNAIISDIEAGMTFADSLEKYPKVFNQVYVSLVKAGETSGTLDQALERIAFQQEKDAEIIRKVKGALTYPVIVLIVMALVLSFMLVKVLPQVEVLYKGIKGATLPLVTRILLVGSHAIQKYWWATIIIIVMMVIGVNAWTKTKSGRNFADRFKMKAWPFGPLFMKLYMARFARTATTLVSSGVPLIAVLEITSNAINNVHISASITKAIESVKGGKSLSDSIEGDNNFLPLLPSMLKIGEQSGEIEKMLAKVADYFEKEVDDQVKAISSLIEPLMMVMLGVMAFVIVAAVLLPVYSLAGNSSFSGG